mgnify:CR=1 FL=1
MIKIAVYSLKGGVGKTITAANLGHLYATHRTKKSKGRSGTAYAVSSWSTGTRRGTCRNISAAMMRTALSS